MRSCVNVAKSRRNLKWVKRCEPEKRLGPRQLHPHPIITSDTVGVGAGQSAELRGF